MRRPNNNPTDACCRCAKLLPTPKGDSPAKGELLIWQPDSNSPPQWICSACHTVLTDEERRV